MKSYVIVDANVINAEKLAQYGAQAAPTIAKYQGKFIAKGSAESLHGNQPFANKAVIEFPSKQHAIDWYNSEEYQALIPLRSQAIDCEFHLTSGV
jgi:uncharacterized protein (DUF1330 family)